MVGRFRGDNRFVLRSGLAAGIAIGIVGDVGTRALGQQPKLFVGMILILIFAEVRPQFNCSASLERAELARCKIRPVCSSFKLC